MTVRRSVLVAALIAAAYTGVAVIGKAAIDAPLTVACALLLGGAMVLVSPHFRGGAWSHFGIWFCLLFLNWASVAVEGTLFAPAAAPPSSLALNLFRLAVGSALIASLVALGGRRSHEVFIELIRHRPLLGWSWRVMVVAAIYLVLYLVLGGLNYTFVTHPYYESHAGSLVVPDAATIFAYEPARGVVIALSVLPLAMGIRLQTRSAALIVGTMLFVIGGLVPLLPQASLPLFLRVSSLWEIFGQNFLTGVASAYLLAAGGRARAQLDRSAAISRAGQIQPSSR